MMDRSRGCDGAWIAARRPITRADEEYHPARIIAYPEQEATKICPVAELAARIEDIRTVCNWARVAEDYYSVEFYQEHQLRRPRGAGVDGEGRQEAGS
jgi:hypothetical protein